MISIIVPAYNESKRIRPFLIELLKFIKKGYYELIIVNDGSTDNTLSIMKKITNGLKKVQIISYKENKGKGYAVKTGVFNAKGEYVIFIDADGSISPSEIPKMERMLKKYDVVIGDRSSKLSKVSQPKMRKLFGLIFNNYVKFLFGSKINDHLCGFKGFRKDVARDIFKSLISNGWIFDVEILYKITKSKYTLFKLPIKWVYKDRTKIKPTDPLKMLLEIFLLRFNV